MALSLPIFLDNHSTTRVDPQVLDAMLPWLTHRFGNASSKSHVFGLESSAATTHARRQVAALIGAEEREIIFTSGATESVNLALKGVSEGASGKKNHIVTVATEHHAVLDTCARLAAYGFDVTTLPVDHAGHVDPDDVRAAITGNTIVVSVMLANNEIGTIAPIAEIGVICREAGVLFHTDATQAAGRVPIDVVRLHVDLLSVSAHKMYGPQGVGALFVRNGIPLQTVRPQIDGGGQERGFRSGTLNVPGIVGLGKAAEVAAGEMHGEMTRTGQLRDALVDGIMTALDGVAINGDAEHRLPNNANLRFEGVRADAVMMRMKDVAVSSGSACSSASPAPSHVLRALGLDDDQVLSSLRFGLGRFTTEEEISHAIERVTGVVQELRIHQYSHA